jgi:hypothetical protein
VGIAMTGFRYPGGIHHHQQRSDRTQIEIFDYFIGRPAGFFFTGSFAELNKIRI